MRDAVVANLVQLARENPKIFLITADLGFGVLSSFIDEFPNQYLNVGVAEQNMMGVATGLALDGRVVFTYSIGNFPTLRCLEQIRNDACYHRANVNIISVGGGLSYGALGYSHHATEDIAIMRSLPELTVVAPGDAWEAGEAVRKLASSPGTSYLRLDKSSAHSTALPGEELIIGKARTIRSGRSLTLISLGGLLSLALKVADELAKESVDCRVLSMHTLKPVDEKAIVAAASETGGIVVLEEHVSQGGLSSIVAEACVTNGTMPIKFLRFGLSEEKLFLVGSQEYLRQRHQLETMQVIGSIRDIFLSQR